MSNPKPSAKGADWTRLLADPDLVMHLGELLRTYRDAPADTRDEALLEIMRRIKKGAAKPAQSESVANEIHPLQPVATAAAATPPFEPSIFTPSWGQDRRRYPRMKCFVAVELHAEGSITPIWGNLANTSMGGCFVETATPMATGLNTEIGLWVSTGKLWVKGVILNGTVTASSPSTGIRIKFADLGPAERETLRQFLKFVETTTKSYQAQRGYLAQMKRP